MIAVIAAFIVLSLALASSRLRQVAALGARMEAWEAPLRRRGPIVIAVISIAVVWFTWDGVVPVPKVHDENSYMLQADIFARFRWTVPSPPIPDFFEQPHVQIEPAVASKYPPGHALLLSLGSMLGFTALVPLLLAGLTAELVFLLATRVTDVWRGLLTWVIWLGAPLVLRFQPSYFSEVTTTPLVLVSWWLLLNWREDHKPKWLLAMALAIGWGAITRPLTMLAFAIPIGVVVVRDTMRLSLWRDLTAATAIGVGVLAILPLWSAKTTGDWRMSPVEKYRLDYLPFDKMGFTVDSSFPRRKLTRALESTYNYFMVARSEQTLAAVPKTAWDRAVQVFIADFQNVRLPLGVLAILGLFVCGGLIRFGVVSGVVLFIAHLPYGYWAPWTVYYMETVPVAAILAAIGAAYVVKRLAAGNEVSARGALGVVTLAVVAFSGPVVWKWKIDHRLRASFDRRFAEQVKQVPVKPAIVFIRYSSRVAQHISEVFNFADLNAAPVWVVHDLGPRNAELRKMFPDRASFDFDEDQLVSGMRRPQQP